MTDRLYHLLKLFQQHQLSAEQARELSALLGNHQEAEDFALMIQKELERNEQILPGNLDMIENRMLHTLRNKISESGPLPPAKVRFISKKWYWVAASILLVAGFMVWLQTGKPPVQQPLASTTEIRPGSTGAFLTLADGSTIVLDSQANGTIASQHGVDIVLENGQLQYDQTKTDLHIVQFNTMTTPQGRIFTLLLPDGTRVWLNAGTSLKYPTRFNDVERKVMLDGEAYFEVKRSAVPFKVSLSDTAEIEVLGTAFNINAYKQEPFVITTLVEGAVLAKIGKQSVQLHPGQQANMENSIRVLQANLEKNIAWKNGVFYCEGVGLREMMRQIERWYNIETEYTPGVPDIRFTGKISRNVQLTDLLSALEKSGVRFKMEQGRKLIVMP